MTTKTEKEISQQLALMKDPDPFIRRDAICSLNGVKDARVLYPLIKAMQDENHGIQQAAMDALMAFDDEAAVFGLLPLLSDGRPFVRNMSREILDRIGGCGIELFKRYINDKDDDVRKMIADILGAIKKPDAKKMLLQMLHDPRSNVRSSAAEGLGRTGDSSVVESLISLLDDDEWVAIFAASSLGRIGDYRAVKPLTRLIYSSGTDLQIIAIEALAQIGGAEAEESLMEIIDSAGLQAVNAAVKGIVRLMQGNVEKIVKRVGSERLFNCLVDAMNDMDQENPSLKMDFITAFSFIRNQNSSVYIFDLLANAAAEDREMMQAAITALARLHEEEALIESLERESRSCLTTSVRVLGDLKSVRAVESLIRLFENVDRDIKIEILSALACIGNKDSAYFLIDMLSYDEGHIRGAAAWSLGMMAMPETAGILFERIEAEEYPDIVEKILNALIQIGMRNNLSSIFEDLVQNLSSKKPFVREAIIKGLGCSGWQKAADHAREMISDENWRVRRACLEVLSNFNDPALPDALITAASDEKDEMRIFAAQLAGQLQGEKSVDLLISFLSDRNNRVIHKSIAGLVGLKADKAVPYLIELARQEDPLLQQISIWALGELAAREAEDILKTTVSHHNPEIRRAAVEAYKKLRDSDNAIC